MHFWMNVLYFSLLMMYIYLPLSYHFMMQLNLVDFNMRMSTFFRPTYTNSQAADWLVRCV